MPLKQFAYSQSAPNWSQAIHHVLTTAFHCSFLSCLIFIAIFISSSPVCADFSIRPSITLTEEYTDNVFDSSDKKSDFITRVMPGVAFTYVMPFWDWDLIYAYDYRFYARNTINGDDTHNLKTHGLIRLIDDFLLLDINDTYGRTSLDVSRNWVSESLVANQTDTNVFTASPYIQFHPTHQITVKTGYRYNNLWYAEPTAVDRRDHIGFIDTEYEYSPRLTMMANYTYTHENSIHAFDRHLPYIGGKYQYGARSFIRAIGGIEFTNPEHGGDSNRPYWDVGITHFFDHTSVTLASTVLFPLDPIDTMTREINNSLGVSMELSRGTVGLSIHYSKFSGPITDDVDSYGASVSAKYELIQNLLANIICSVDRYDHRYTDSYERRILVNPSLSYALPNEFNVGIYYFFIDSYSQLHGGSFQSNRVGFELTKTFGREVEKIKNNILPEDRTHGQEAKLYRRPGFTY